jgi:Bacteriophage holin family
MVGTWLREFASDTKVHVALLLVVIDFILGVAAAVKAGTFRMSYVADFARNDILFKLLPYFALYAAAIVAGHEDIVIPGLDFGVFAGAFYALIVAAWVGSILSSLTGFGLKIPTRSPKAATALAGNENTPGVVHHKP